MSDGFDFEGSYAYGCKSSHAPNPCIALEGVGLVGLPLSSRDANAIIQSAQPAPFGKDNLTLVDREVRHTWEIHPKQLSFQNAE